jgi:tripartite-type tricarboxylate transporter receptor subunit TctC
MKPTVLARRAFVLMAALAPALSAMAQGADSWPGKAPIKLIIPGPPGGAMDIFGRLLQVPMEKALKQTIVMDYKPGANSIIGIDALAKSAPDGYTILIAPSSAIAINPVIQPKLPFNVLKDLAPVAQVGAAGVLLMTNPGTGFKTLKDMVDYAKAHPGKLGYGSWGYGSTAHLVMEGIKAHYGLDMPHIPYKTTAQELTDLLSDNLKVAFTDIASPVPHIRAGKLVALGVTGSSRGPALPDLPTVTEQGYKFEADGWFGIFAPAGTPQAIIDQLNSEIGKAMALEDTRGKFAQRNMAIPPHKSAAQFAATVKSDLDLWQGLAKKANLKID